MLETVKLIECYRNTFQGEGVDSGKRVSLFRFKYCNKKCKWCDTLLKMRIQQEAKYRIVDLQKILDEEKTIPMITGGEPTIKNHFNDNSSANIESNGFNLLKLIEKVNPSKKVKYSYSPKIFAEDDLKIEIEKSKKLSKISNVYFKIVYEKRDLIEEYLEFVEELNINQRVYLMVKGITREELLKNASEVFDIAEKLRFNFSSRDHIIYNFI